MMRHTPLSSACRGEEAAGGHGFGAYRQCLQRLKRRATLGEQGGTILLKLLALLLGLAAAHAAQPVTLSDVALSYMEADNSRAKECYPPGDPFCPYGPVVSYTVTNNTNGAIVARVRCTIYDAVRAPISSRLVLTPVRAHDTSLLDSAAFFHTLTPPVAVADFGCVIERVLLTNPSLNE